MGNTPRRHPLSQLHSRHALHSRLPTRGEPSRSSWDAFDLSVERGSVDIADIRKVDGATDDRPSEDNKPGLMDVVVGSPERKKPVQVVYQEPLRGPTLRQKNQTMAVDGWACFQTPLSSFSFSIYIFSIYSKSKPLSSCSSVSSTFFFISYPSFSITSSSSVCLITAS